MFPNMQRETNLTLLHPPKQRLINNVVVEIKRGFTCISAVQLKMESISHNGIMAKSENKNFYQLYCEFRCIKTQYLIMESWQILHLYLAWGMGSCSLSLPLSLSLKFTDPQSIWIAGCKITFVPTVKHHDFVYFYLKPINNVPIPVPAPL